MDRTEQHLSDKDLGERLDRVDGRGYPRYQLIVGSYVFSDHTMRIDRTQRDPFAPPTLIRVFVSRDAAGFDPSCRGHPVRQIALCDLLTRRLGRSIEAINRGHRGSGNSGVVQVALPGQEILERTSVQLKGDQIEARLYVGLPALGRRIDAEGARIVLCDEVAAIVLDALFADRIDTEVLLRHLDAAEDQDSLRSKLSPMGLVAFVGDGTVLPRQSGVDDRPMDPRNAVVFRSPPSLSVQVDVPNRGTVTGMGIPQGVTVITGGGYHGKSTLLRALERGIYDHIPGDGRELVVTCPDAVKVRAEEGRSVKHVDLRPFIEELPSGVDVSSFSTDDASGSISQAASVVESLELGATVLLMDEDTSASNFMSRDKDVMLLVSEALEPIRPLVRYVRSVADQGISMVVAVGGTGAFFGKADCVLRIANYVAENVTPQARQISSEGQPLHQDQMASFRDRQPRVACTWSIDGRKGEQKVRVRGRELVVGDERLDLSAIEQICSDNQAEGLGRALLACQALVDGKRSFAEILSEVELVLSQAGLDGLGHISGALVRPRRLEVGAGMNRARKMAFT